ncbi:hypothetical protein X735_32390 [Mesorhizobium sp. L2C085B000]|nr:hypothetical protein X735_32390 [Mesorhizobium sp. L2C085B000]
MTSPPTMSDQHLLDIGQQHVAVHGAIVDESAVVPTSRRAPVKVVIGIPARQRSPRGALPRDHFVERPISYEHELPLHTLVRSL